MDREVRKETDLFGREKDVVYENGEKVAEIRHEQTLFGQNVERAYDTEGKLISETKHEQTLWETPVDRTYAPDGSRLSETRHEETFTGRPIDRTYDSEGRLTSESTSETTFFGTHFRKVRDIAPTGSVSSPVSSSSGPSAPLGSTFSIPPAVVLALLLIGAALIGRRGSQTPPPNPIPTAGGALLEDTSPPNTSARPTNESNWKELDSQSVRGRNQSPPLISLEAAAPNVSAPSSQPTPTTNPDATPVSPAEAPMPDPPSAASFTATLAGSFRSTSGGRELQGKWVWTAVQNGDAVIGDWRAASAIAFGGIQATYASGGIQGEYRDGRFEGRLPFQQEGCNGVLNAQAQLSGQTLSGTFSGTMDCRDWGGQHGQRKVSISNGIFTMTLQP